MLVAGQDDDRADRPRERAPTLVREYPPEEHSPALQVRPLRSDGSRHGVIAADADASAMSLEHEDPDHLQRRRRDLVRQADDHDHAENAEDQFLPVHEFPAQGVAQEAEGDLDLDDVSDVRAGVDEAAEERGVVGCLPARRPPQYW